jgi:hypothetical protein
MDKILYEDLYFVKIASFIFFQSKIVDNDKDRVKNEKFEVLYCFSLLLSVQGLFSAII